MRTNGHAEVDEDDDIDKLQFNEEDYNGHDDDEIEEEEEDNSDYKDFELIFLCRTSMCNEIDINAIFSYVVVL
jgi:rhodanese-related sulfurtransferase